MLRTLRNDEGCDIECPLCGRHCLYGKCFRCGYIIPCVGCGVKSEVLLVDDCDKDKKLHFLRMCNACADKAFELQNDDSTLPRFF